MFSQYVYFAVGLSSGTMGNALFSVSEQFGYYSTGYMHIYVYRPATYTAVNAA